jgi:hypothetical protein
MNPSMQQFVLNLIVGAMGPILTVVSGRESDRVLIGVMTSKQGGGGKFCIVKPAQRGSDS